MNNLLKFPKGFFWGAATSAHQVEGNNYNDWTEWEKSNAKRLAREAETYWQPWQKKRFPEMLKPENYISGVASDHYNRYEEDFNLARAMNNNAHRFSIEWSRVEPEEGKFNQAEIEHYRKVILALKTRDLEPFVTLWHWTMPVWFAQKGGFEKQENIKYFTRFCEKIVKEFKNDVKFWITINEANIYAGMSYVMGVFPPQKHNILTFLRVTNNLVKAHCAAYNVIHNLQDKCQIGIAHNANYFKGWAAPIIKRFWCFYFLNKIQDYQDFIGLNYYYRRLVKGFNFDAGKGARGDRGWEIYPKGIYHVLKILGRYHKPIYITENGLADEQDEYRAKFIINHLKWIHRAISEDIDVRGYFHWSLLDNFEWDKGFWPRFGLVEVDYKTLERKIRPSGYVYAEIAKNNAIENNALNK